MTTITIDRELLEQALVALSAPNHCVFSEPPICVDIRAALAAPATAPAWHVAPTVPGLWLNSVFMKVEDVEQWHIGCQLHLECARWFGRNNATRWNARSQRSARSASRPSTSI